MKPLRLGIAGLGAWSVRYPDWPTLAAALAGRGNAAQSPGPPDAARPQPTLLPPAERRRTPAGVAVALQVADEAASMATALGIDRASLASVFVSAHGDLAIVDYLCATLADDPTALSPTRFHLSVHNAASGYWTIAAADVAPSTAIAAGETSFAAGLLEAATMAVAERRPVLLVAFDTQAVGLLARAAPNTALSGFAMVLDPRLDGTMRTLSLTVAPTADESDPPAAFAELAASSPAGRALVLAQAIAAGGGRCALRLGPDVTLRMDVEPGAPGA